MNCNTCHGVAKGTEGGFTPAAALQQSQDLKVPHLRNVYQKLRFANAPGAQSLLGFGLTHDGDEPSLTNFLSRLIFGSIATNTVQKQNIAAFVLCFDTGTAPAVGYARTITAANVTSASVSNDWSLLEAQAVGGTNIDLIVKGVLDGRRQGFLFVTASNRYRADQLLAPQLTRAALVTKVLAGGTISIMGVPPGTGMRVGIDRNSNGVLDGDEPLPSLQIVRAAANAIVAWSTNAAGFVLETTVALPADWATETSVRGVVGTEFNVTNALAPNDRFFRLKGL